MRRLAAAVATATLLASMGVAGVANSVGVANSAVPQSTNVALVPNAFGRFNFGGTLPTTVYPGGFAPTFTNVTPESIRDDATNPLTPFDTVVLNGMCDIGTFLAVPQFESRIDSFVFAGGKLIIYDSECTATNYTGFVFPFTTSNPGAAGATGTLTIAENDTLGSGTSGDPSFLDVNLISTGTDAVGDANVFTSFDQNWCVHMRATNVLGVNGPATAYAHYGLGLIVYTGLDKDLMNSANGYLGTGGTGASNLNRVFLLQLLQPFNPDNLPCGVKVFGISLSPKTASNDVGTTHTVTAHLTSNGLPVDNATVTFTVLTGPNAVLTGTGTTGPSGDATFTYTGSGGAGTDTIEASATLAGTGGVLTTVTDRAEKDWTAATGTITVHKTVDAGGASPTSFCFTLSPDPGNGQVCANGSGDAVFSDVPAGTYDAVETASPPSYHQVSTTCAGLNLAGGGSLTCDVHDALNLTLKHLTYKGSMEGALRFQKDDWVNGGFHFWLSQKNTQDVQVLVTGSIDLPVRCGSAKGTLAGTISVPVSLPLFTIPAGSTDKYLTPDQNDILAWIGAVRATDLCPVGQTMYNSEGATFDVIIGTTAHTGGINFQWHYRIPAAKNKPNTNCTDATDPNRARADVCGASWSATKDP